MTTTATATSRRVLIDNQGLAKLNHKLEESEGVKKLYAEGKIGHCGIATANGRIYPVPIVSREIARLQPRLEQSSLYAAVDHPGDGKSRIRDAGAIIRGLRIESDGSIWGKFQIVEDTDCGRNLAAILRAGGAVGVSSRGLGSTTANESGQEVVGEDFRLVSFDFVLDPAVQTAYPSFFSEDTNVEKEMTAKVTPDALRAKFPTIVKAIIEDAQAVASQTTVEAIRSEVEADVEKAVTESKEQLRDQFKAELYPEVVKELKEDFGAKLIRATASIRKDVEAVVRSEMAADPQVAGAKMALEQIANIVSPFKPTGDAAKVIAEKDGTVEELKKSLTKLEKAFEVAQADKKLAEAKARELGFRLFVEKKVTGRNDGNTIREMVGDVTKITTVEELQQKVCTAIEAADKALSEAVESVKAGLSEEQKVSEKKADIAQKRVKKIEEQDDLLRSKVARLTEQLEAALAEKDGQLAKQQRQLNDLAARLERAGEITEQLETKAFAATRLAGHPKKTEIMNQIQSGALKGKKAVSKLAEDTDFSADEVGAHERVRHFFGKGREFMPEEMRKQREQLDEAAGSTPVPNLEEMDMGLIGSVEEIRRLARAGQRQ
jgi:prohead core protein serine protease